MARLKILPRIYQVLFVLLCLQVLFVALLIRSTDHAPSRAILSMGLVLIGAWVCCGGILMYSLRDSARVLVRRLIDRFSLDWRLVFVVFATLLALIEEAITTLLTNLAPLFGVSVGEAYITASANYLEVVTLHSVVIFIPMFAAWAWLLSRYNFTPSETLLLFGITGFIGEMMSFGATIIALPMWILIYGLLVYLPAHCALPERVMPPVRPIHYPLAIVMPLLWAVPVVLLVVQFHPTPTQFPPIVFPE